MIRHLPEDAITIRNYETGDESELVRLHRQVFGSNLSCEEWRWKYKQQPQGTSWITLAEHDGSIIGQRCLLRHHLNYTGRELVAGQACDTLVHPDHRRKGLFGRLGTSNYRWANADGVTAIFNFPNRNSFPGYVRYLGWNKVCSLRYYYYRLGYRKLYGVALDRAARILKGALIKGETWLRRSLLEERESLQVRHLEEVPVDFEASLAHVRDHEILSIWKDVPYLRWRYAEHPSNDYTFHLLYRDTHPEGLIVTRDREHTIAICDVLHRTKAAVPTALLLTEVVRFYQDSQAQKMEFFGHDDGFFDVVFATAGFTREPASSFVFGGRVFDNPNLHDIFFRRQNWTISYGDTDVV